MQDESAEQTFNKAKEILQDAILRDYPNPERRGCPGTEVLKRLASSDLPQTSDPAWHHVTHCSPCYGEFLAFREEVRAARRRVRQRRRIVLAAAAVLIVVCGLWILLRRSPGESRREVAGKQPPAGGVAPVSPIQAYLDMEPIQIHRGQSGTNRQLKLRLPIGDLDLKVRLPIGSEDGQYQVQILRQPGEAPVALGEGTASLQDHSVFLRTRIDLKELKAGKYYVAFRKVNMDWTVLPLELGQ